MTSHVTMTAAVADYLAFRRKLGFALHIEGEELGRFARFVDQIGHRGPITTELALQWATEPTSAKRLYHARRLDMVRRLARHVAVFEPETEIPPKGLLGPSNSRPDPYIYSDEEIAALLESAAQLGPAGGLRPLTYTTLFGLLACTGLRISEALAFSRQEVDLEAGILTITTGKSHRSRLVPLHLSAVEALRVYAEARARYSYHRRPRSADTYFVSEFGTSLKYVKVRATFGDLRDRLGWHAGRTGRRPRIHDIRHTFAVRRIMCWYDEGVDVDRKIASLSSYLGHVKVSDTYWYLTAVPELLAKPAARFEHLAGSMAGGEGP